MLIKRLMQRALTLTMVGLIAACFDGKSSNGDNDSTRFSLAVTDAPIDAASQVVVEFSGIVLKPSGDEQIEVNLGEPVKIDLLALQGHVSQYIVTDESIPPGDYDWIRLVVNAEIDGVMDSYVELKNGSQLELVIPSGEQTGLKLTQGFVIQEGGQADFTVDFDLRQSIVIPSNTSITTALMKPVLRIVDTPFSGSIEGELDEIIVAGYCTNPSVDDGAVFVFTRSPDFDDIATGNQTPISSAMVHYKDGSYRYEVGFLPTGNYHLVYTCSTADDGLEPQEFTYVDAGTGPVTVNLAENVIVDFRPENLVNSPTSPTETPEQVDGGSEVPIEAPTPSSPDIDPSPEPAPDQVTEDPVTAAPQPDGPSTPDDGNKPENPGKAPTPNEPKDLKKTKGKDKDDEDKEEGKED